MEEQRKERLFGEIAIDLGFLTAGEIEAVLEKQKAGEAGGVRRVIGEYLLEEKKLTPAQIEEILKIQEMAVQCAVPIVDHA